MEREEREKEENKIPDECLKILCLRRLSLKMLISVSSRAVFQDRQMAK